MITKYIVMHLKNEWEMCAQSRRGCSNTCNEINEELEKQGLTKDIVKVERGAYLSMSHNCT